MSNNSQPHLLHLFKDSNAWAGGMVHQLREFAALPEDQDLISRSHMGIHIHL